MYLSVAAVKLTPSTKENEKKTIEIELSNWFANVRDRGEGGRKGGAKARSNDEALTAIN